MLSRGFTTVRDTGGASKALATAIDEGLIDGPRLFQCGKAISQTGMEGLRDLNGWRGVDHFEFDAIIHPTASPQIGGHGDFRKEPRPSATSCCGSVKSLGRVADGLDAVLRATREELSLGADFIKVRFTVLMCSTSLTIQRSWLAVAWRAQRTPSKQFSTCQRSCKPLQGHASRWATFIVSFEPPPRV